MGLTHWPPQSRQSLVWPNHTTSCPDCSFPVHLPQPISHPLLFAQADFLNPQPDQSPPRNFGKPPIEPQLFPCPHLSKHLCPLIFQIGRESIALQILRLLEVFHLQPIDPFLGRLPRVWHQSLGSKTKCCTHAVWCGVPSTLDREGKRRQTIPQRKRLHHHHRCIQILGYIAKTWAH